MLLPPIVLGLLGLAIAGLLDVFALLIIVPMASAIANFPIASHLGFGLDFGSPVLWLSILTWLLGGVVFWQFDAIRTVLRRFDAEFGWSFDRAFDAAMFGLIRLASALTRALHHGRLELYLLVVFAMLALALLVPLLALGGLPVAVALPELTFYEWGVVVLALIGLAAVVFARSRLIAIVSLGIQGFAVALIFMLFGAPDLSFTQFMVEILSVVILALVMTRLRLDLRDRRSLVIAVRDGILALAGGAGVLALLLVILAGPLDTRLSDFFEAHSVATAHGHNIVNVILVDFRGLDTLGEISVVMTAGIAVLALLRGRKLPAPAGPSTEPVAKSPSRRRRGRAA